VAAELIPDCDFDWEALIKNAQPTWWQTETGWPIAANCMRIEPFSPKAGSPTKAVPGHNVQISDGEGHVFPNGQEGYVIIKSPLPPGCLPTLWNDDERYLKYVNQIPGYYAQVMGDFIG
jgi:propionyl-CoA synthetase